MTFEKWLEAVDKEVVDLCRLSLADLPDWCYYQAWEAKFSPRRAAKAAIEYAKEF